MIKKRLPYTKQSVLFFFFVALFLISSAQKPATADTTSKVKRTKFDYGFLKEIPEFNTKIYGKVNITGKGAKTQLYRKGELFGDTFSYLLPGATVEVLNTELPLNKTSHKVLVKVISNPPADEAVGNVGWMHIDHTTLLQYLDEDNKRIDTNRMRTRYLASAVKLRDQAQKTTCRENKKCQLEWADYYDCMSKVVPFDATPKCAYANCAVVDCPGDAKVD